MAENGEREGISRRSLLVAGGAGVGLVIAWAVWPRAYSPNLRLGEGETLFGPFLKIARDGRVIVAVPQAELGQGVWTTLPQVLADELGADWRTVAVEPAPLGPLYANRLFAEEQADAGLPASFRSVGRRWAGERATRSALMITGGSTSARAFEPRMREAGAAARALLSKAAARRWNADWQELDAREGFVWRGEERIAFGELAEAAAGEELPDDLPIRGGIDNRLYGQPLPRLDAPSKLDGSALFAGDVRLPDMVFAAVRSGPPGSRLAGFDRAAAEAVHGAMTLFENPEWIGVAATNWWAAARALHAAAPRFEGPAGPDGIAIDAALAAALDGPSGEMLAEQGDPDAPVAGGGRLAARYVAEPAPTAAPEPLTATARLAAGRLEIWAPTQAPGLARAAAAAAIGISEDRVTIHATLAGGGYGRKIESEAIVQAAVMAAKLGRPVQLTWPRIEELRRERMRAPAAADLRAQLGPGGAVLAWSARTAAPPFETRTFERLGAGSRFIRPDAAAAAGAVPPYSIPALRIEHVAAEVGIESGLWRSGAHSYTCFFTECFVDELARAAAIEPLSFRMQMLSANPRLARALATATSYGGWDGGGPGSAMGLACLSAFGSHIATLVEIEVTGAQRIRVLRAVCAVDCGRAINPDVVRQQIEGGLLFGIGAATGAPVALANGMPTARTLGDLRLPLLADAPEISIELIESDEDPGGVTELAVPTAAPAIANALHASTGQRLRRLPLVPGSGR